MTKPCWLELKFASPNRVLHGKQLCFISLSYFYSIWYFTLHPSSNFQYSVTFQLLVIIATYSYSHTSKQIWIFYPDILPSPLKYTESCLICKVPSPKVVILSPKLSNAPSLGNHSIYHTALCNVTACLKVLLSQCTPLTTSLPTFLLPFREKYLL